MREYPDFKFTMSSARTYSWMEEKYPDLFKEIQERVKEGRWEIVGGMWVEPDLNIARRRIAGAADSGGETVLSAEVWRRRQDRVESRFVWIQLATAADLQESGN